MALLEKLREEMAVVFEGNPAGEETTSQHQFLRVLTGNKGWRSGFRDQSEIYLKPEDPTLYALIYALHALPIVRITQDGIYNDLGSGVSRLTVGEPTGQHFLHDRVITFAMQQTMTDMLTSLHENGKLNNLERELHNYRRTKRFDKNHISVSGDLDYMQQNYALLRAKYDEGFALAQKDGLSPKSFFKDIPPYHEPADELTVSELPGGNQLTP
jgi:hypothetical protein